MQNPNKKTHPIFKAGYNITQRVRQDEKFRNFSEYSQRYVFISFLNIDAEWPPSEEPLSGTRVIKRMRLPRGTKCLRR